MTEGIYHVKVMHARVKPVRQYFTIRGYSFLIDLARFSAGRVDLGFAHQFRRRDFSLLAGRGESATAQAIAYLEEKTGISADRVFLLANPRIFGYVFNPVSFFFCYQAGKHVATVVEVNNTFGEQKHYVLPAGVEPKLIRKNFYVSPFLSPFADFRLRVKAPGDRLSIGIHTHNDAGPQLVAELHGRRFALKTRNTARFFFQYPFHTIRVIVLIHWYAFRLYLARVPFYPKAAADAAVAHQSLRSHS